MYLRKVNPAELNAMSKNTMIETLGIVCTEVGDDYLIARMPVNKSTHQPMGLLHGGASVALIESLGSIGSALAVNLDVEVPVGLEVNANHISAVSEGYVVAKGRLIHCGKKTHVWQVDVNDEASGNLVCTGRLTVMIIPRK